ncbi:hypothetical protein [Halovivax limisalsi]|uniref:hypothetical protein n=1 Tax=Halovivax limisalsi TaxID=1453760 RepID=UPI001FFD1FA2|nr:hypothetical protein [Halovivax limisalsi]
MSRDSADDRAGRLSTDRETIRDWADEHRATPVRRAGEGTTAESTEYRIVDESDVGDSHERAEWDEFFDHLDEGDRIVVYRGADADEPFEVTSRDEAITRTGLSETELEERLIEGETVTSEIQETTVVESVVVEEATVESELVETSLVDQEVLDVELVERECTGCRLVDDESVEGGHRDWFDEEGYFGSVERAGSMERGSTATGDESGTGTMDDESTMGAMDDDTGPSTESGVTDAERRAIDTSTVPYAASFDVEEVWSVTRGFVERFTVESRVSETDVAETETVEDRDIDVEGLHRSIATSDLLDVGLSSEDVLNECEIQTEFDEDDRIRTHFDRERVVEDEVVDRKRLEADVTGGSVLEMEVLDTRDVATEITDESAADAGTATGAEPSTEAAGGGAAGPESGDAIGDSAGVEPDASPGRVTLTDDDVGKTVVDATGEEVGMVSTVEENGEVMRVDAHPGITDRIKAALDWGDGGEDDYPVEIEQIRRITDDQVELKGTDELGGLDRAD